LSDSLSRKWHKRHPAQIVFSDFSIRLFRDFYEILKHERTAYRNQQDPVLF